MKPEAALQTLFNKSWHDKTTKKTMLLVFRATSELMLLVFRATSKLMLLVFKATRKLMP